MLCSPSRTSGKVILFEVDTHASTVVGMASIEDQVMAAMNNNSGGGTNRSARGATRPGGVGGGPGGQTWAPSRATGSRGGQVRGGASQGQDEDPFIVESRPDNRIINESMLLDGRAKFAISLPW
jgi:hypothetical protein